MSEFEYSVRLHLAEVNALQSTDLDALMPAIQERLGETDFSRLKFLGKGIWADVFWLSNRKKVVKVTNDLEDANASFIIHKKPSPEFAKVHDVFALTSKSRTSYCIVNEKLTELDSSTKRTIENVDSVWRSVLGSFANVTPKNVQTVSDAFSDPKVETYIDKLGLTYRDFDILVGWAKALQERHIKWMDFKSANTMMRGRKLVISDVGAGSSPRQSIPILTY